VNIDIFHETVSSLSQVLNFFLIFLVYVFPLSM